MKTIGQRLKSERKRLALGLIEFANIGGVGKSTQARYELCQGEPAADYLKKIGVHGANIQWILHGGAIDSAAATEPCGGEPMQTTGERLKAERERLGLTQKTVATAFGTTTKTQIDYELGRNAPNARYLEKAAVLGVDVQYVITGRASATALSTKEVELLAAYRKAGKSKRMALEAFLKSMEVLP